MANEERPLSKPTNQKGHVCTGRTGSQTVLDKCLSISKQLAYQTNSLQAGDGFYSLVLAFPGSSLAESLETSSRASLKATLAQSSAQQASTKCDLFSKRKNNNKQILRAHIPRLLGPKTLYVNVSRHVNVNFKILRQKRHNFTHLQQKYNIKDARPASPKCTSATESAVQSVQ